MEDPLDGDGVVNIFPVLAQSAPGDAGRARPFTGCRMAPTVTYIYQTKAHWYFSDPRDLSLSTRLKKDLFIISIYIESWPRMNCDTWAGANSMTA